MCDRPGGDDRYNTYGPGTGPIWLYFVDCEGHETHFDQCFHPPLGVHNCNHTRDVSIWCPTYSAEQYSGWELLILFLGSVVA